MTRAPRTPSFRHHKASGQGVVELNGVEVYLGKWGLPETEQRYHRTISEWIANGRRRSVPEHEITITELVLQYWEYAESYYASQDGKPSEHLACIKPALRLLRELYGDTPAAEFGPKRLRALQSQWAAAKLSLHTCNARLQFVKRLFRWASSLEKVPPSLWHGLTCVEGLRAGRSGAKAAKVVAPVEMEHVNAIREHVAPPVWAMIQLQIFTGARSGELVKLRPCDVDRQGEVWQASLKEHKGAWRGKARVIAFGPLAQAVLRPFLLRPSDSFCFSPKESMAWHAARCEKHRRPNQKPNPRKTERQVRDHYDPAGYRRAVVRACEEAGVPHWFPHQLRHLAATRIREQYGLEGAQVVLGHAHMKITEVYAEANQQKARDIVKEIG